MSAPSRTPARHRRRPRRPARVALAGVVTLTVIAGLMWLAENAYNGVPLLGYRTVYVSLPNIGHLKQHDPVNIAGVRVGQVLKTSTRGNRPLVELQLRGVGPLPADSRVVVRAQGLLGARYVELKPGRSSQTLSDGATIVEHGNTYASGVPETLDLFDVKTRTALGHMIRGLGDGMLGRGTQLNQAISVGPRSGHDFDTAAYAILARPRAAANFLPAMNGGFTALNSARDDLANMMDPAATTLDAIVERRSKVQAAIDVLPSWFKTISTSIGSNDIPAPGPAIRLLPAVDALSRALARELPGLPQRLQATTALLNGAARPLARTKQVLDVVPSASSATLRILAALRPNLAPLRTTLMNLLPPVTVLARNGCDIQNFATGARSMVSFGAVPGGNWGPDVGFPLAIVPGPQQAASIADVHAQYGTEDVYAPPCAYSPGPVIPITQFLTTTGGGPK